MKKILLVSLLFLAAVTVSSDQISKQCSTLSCVHAAATVIQKLNTQVDPCDDFYEFACGSFIEQQHTPDEKSTVDTIALMTDKLTEYLLTLLLKESPEREAKLPKLAKALFNSCYNTSESPTDLIFRFSSSLFTRPQLKWMNAAKNRFWTSLRSLVAGRWLTASAGTRRSGTGGRQSWSSANSSLKVMKTSLEEKKVRLTRLTR